MDSPRPTAPTPSSVALLELLRTADFHQHAINTYVRGPVHVEVEGFTTVSRYADPAGLLLDWSARFAPGTPINLIAHAIRTASVSTTPHPA